MASWLSTFKIPGDRAYFGIADVLSDSAEINVRGILDGFVKETPAAGLITRRLASALLGLDGRSGH